MKRAALTVLATSATLLAMGGGANAATLNVMNTNDSGSGSLRATIASASAGDTVVLPAMGPRYQVTSGEIPITVAPLTIQGAGASSSIIDASGGTNRIFHVTATPASTSTITIQGVTITGGKATAVPGGGGILVDKVSNTVSLDLALVNAVVSGNTATFSTGDHVCCSGGGGIYSKGGNVTLTGSQVNGNTATVTGSTASGAPEACCDGGGGIWNSYGNVTLTASQVNGNTATVTGDYGFHGGGGIYSNGNVGGNVTVSAGSQVSNNSVTVNDTQTDITGVFGNCCSGGGGIYQDSSATSIQNSALTGNTVTINSGGCCHGGGAVYDDGNGGTITASTLSQNTGTVNGPSTVATTHCCSGGGALMALTAASAPPGWTLTNSTLDGNTSSVTASDCCHGGGAIQIFAAQPLKTSGTTISNNRSLISGGTTSGGGGVYEHVHALLVGSFTNSTISGNTTTAGGTSAMGGGGIYLNNTASYSAVLANVTLAGNSAPSGSGGGIYNLGSKLNAKNSIVALNTASTNGNCYTINSGVFTSFGYNLEDSPDTCSFTATGDKVVSAGSVGLGPLANNGGPTQTRALLSGSPAIDAGNPAGCTDPAGALLTTDQRGFKRPSNGRCDIGAFELQFGAAKCTLKAKSNKVLLKPKKKQKRLKGALQLTVNCNQATTVSLAGKLTEKKKGAKKSKGKSISLKTVNQTVASGQTITIILKLPKKALTALKHKTKESVALTLTATNANGNSSATLKISKLKGTKH